MDIKAIEDLAKKERAEYLRKWKANNRDKVKKYNQDYWKRRAMRKLQNQTEAQS